jgi:hypothetical protein
MSQFVKKLLCVALGLFVIVGSLGASEWYEKVKVKGDIRYRFEWYGNQNWTTDSAGNDFLEDTLHARYRNRIRARVGIEAKPEDNLELYVGLASGSSDPVSTNQTLDDYFTTKAINLDLAYFKWYPVEGLWLNGGKIKKPWHLASSAFWDGDLNPEGLAVGYDGSFGAVSPFVNVNYLWVDEIKAKQDEGENDVMLLGGQGGAAFKFGPAKLQLGVGYQIFTNIQGHDFFAEGFGNTEGENLDSIPIIDPVTLDTTDWEMISVANGTYHWDYNVILPSLKFDIKLGEFPIGLYVDLAYNLGVDSLNLGYMAGIKLGKVSDPGTFEIAANYGALQEDCMVGTFVDSDFAGGGTDNNGMKFTGAVQVTKKMTLGATFFANTQNPNHPDDQSKKYYRFQGDLQYKF